MAPPVVLQKCASDPPKSVAPHGFEHEIDNAQYDYAVVLARRRVGPTRWAFALLMPHIRNFTSYWLSSRREDSMFTRCGWELPEAKVSSQYEAFYRFTITKKLRRFTNNVSVLERGLP